MPIPKIIWTIWLNENKEPPTLIDKCIKTHTLDGYEHRLITLENCYKGTQYIQECLLSKRWAKAADYLRIYYLNQEGGIYLDADVEVLKPFDDLLNQEMFVGEEENGFVANGIIGSVPNHPILKDYLGKVERNFIGSGDLVFQQGMFLWTEIVKYSQGVTIYPPEYFLPYNHHLDRLKLTKNSYCIHHFSKSWVQPKVTFILPTLGKRPDGLKRCLDSIRNLNYPQNLIEVLVIEDNPRIGVPKRLKEGLERSTGDYIVYASDDVEFRPDSINNALLMNKGLVAFNTGDVYPDEGNVCEHFIIKRSLLPKIGDIFDIDFNHVGVDNLLWAKCKKLGEAVRCDKAIVKHHHFAQGGRLDATYETGWDKVDQDRELLKQKMLQL